VREATRVPYVVLFVLSLSPLKYTVRDEATGAIISKVVVPLRSPLRVSLSPEIEAVRSK